MHLRMTAFIDGKKLGNGYAKAYVSARPHIDGVERTRVDSGESSFRSCQNRSKDTAGMLVHLGVFLARRRRFRPTR